MDKQRHRNLLSTFPYKKPQQSVEKERQDKRAGRGSEEKEESGVAFTVRPPSSLLFSVLHSLILLLAFVFDFSIDSPLHEHGQLFDFTSSSRLSLHRHRNPSVDTIEAH